jgi:ABC-type multidrug transport system ATPase subunit
MDANAGQLDQHLPFLTVRETLEFIHNNALVDPAECGHLELAEQHRNRVDDVLTLLHLHNCADTVVGNDLLRGVSGGEKKRVTVGEGLMTNARVLLLEYASSRSVDCLSRVTLTQICRAFLRHSPQLLISSMCAFQLTCQQYRSEISTGLDASVTFDIMHSLRKRAQENKLSVVVSLLQPTPETFALFDEIILMREGRVVRLALSLYFSVFLSPSFCLSLCLLSVLCLSFWLSVLSLCVFSPAVAALYFALSRLFLSVT